MQKKYLYGILGLVIGIAVSFTWTRSYNNTNAGTIAPAAAPGAAGAPANSSGGQQAAMGDVAKTIESAKNNRSDFNAQVEAAMAFDQIGRVDETVEYLVRAYEADTSKFAELDARSKASRYIGNYYAQKGKYAEADTWLNRALTVETNDEDKAFLNILLGESFNEREPKQPDKAIQHLQTALKIDPNNAQKNAHALGHLVEAYALKKDARSAEDALNKLKEAEPTNSRIAALQTMLADLKAGKPVTIPKE